MQLHLEALLARQLVPVKRAEAHSKAAACGQREQGVARTGWNVVA